VTPVAPGGVAAGVGAPEGQARALVTVTVSSYSPGQTQMVAPSLASRIADWIVLSWARQPWQPRRSSSTTRGRVDDYAAAQGVRLTVTDQRGVVVAAPGAARRGLRSRAGDPLVRAALQGRSGVGERSTGIGRVVSAYEPIADISRIETGSLSLSPEPVDVLEVVKDTVDLIGPLAAEREITVQAPSAGDGIPADKMARLFKPFDRLGAEQSEVQGTGMGLALSKGLVEAMGAA
jgi:sensor histidine kinase regulating citrate/malate metabolism